MVQYRFIRVHFNVVTQCLFRIVSPVIAGIQIRKIDARRCSAWLKPERQQESRLRLIQIAGVRVHVALVGLWAYRGKWILPELRILIPASLAGIAVGTLMFEYMSPARLRLLLGVIAVAFTLYHWLQSYLSKVTEQKLFGPAIGIGAAAVAGFTSFIAHAGGPPITMYLLRRGINRTQFVATTVVFFAVVNYVKLFPYAWLGQFDAGNLKTSLILAPLAPVGIGIGVWLHNRVTDRFFFRVAYSMLFVVGIKLMVDGITGL